MHATPRSADETAQSNNEIPASLLTKANQEIRKDFPLFSSLQITDFKPLTGGFWSLKEDALGRIVWEYTASIEKGTATLAQVITRFEEELTRLQKVLAELTVPDIARRDAASAEANRLAQEKSKPENKGKWIQERLETQKRDAIAIVDEVKAQERAQKNGQAEIEACVAKLNAKRTEKLTMDASKTVTLTSLRERLESLYIKQPVVAAQPIPVSESLWVKKIVSHKINAVRIVLLSALAIGGPAVLWQLLKKEPEKSGNNPSALVSSGMQSDINEGINRNQNEKEAEEQRNEVRKNEIRAKYIAAYQSSLKKLSTEGDVSTFREILESEIRNSFTSSASTINVVGKQNALWEAIFEIDIKLSDGYKFNTTTVSEPIKTAIESYMKDQINLEDIHRAVEQIPNEDALNDAIRRILFKATLEKTANKWYQIDYDNSSLKRDPTTGRPYINIIYSFRWSMNNASFTIPLGRRTHIREVNEWMGDEASKGLTPEETEECAEKIKIVKKYPDLMKKYLGDKIMGISLLGLICEVPEEFAHFPHVQEKMKRTWEEMIKADKEEVIYICNRYKWWKDLEKALFNLFAKYYPEILTVSEGVFSCSQVSFGGSSVGTAEDSVTCVSLTIHQKGEKQGALISLGEIGPTIELQKASFKPYIEFIQTSIKKRDNGFDFIGKKMTQSEFIKLFEVAVTNIIHKNQFGTIMYPAYIACEIRPLSFQGDTLIGVGFILDV